MKNTASHISALFNEIPTVPFLTMTCIKYQTDSNESEKKKKKCLPATIISMKASETTRLVYNSEPKRKAPVRIEGFFNIA
jgi:hypothetical protein